MKKNSFFLFLIFLTLASCTSNYKMPSLQFKFTETQKKDTLFYNFVRQQRDRLNDFNRFLSASYRKLDKAVKEGKFDELSKAQQAAWVRLDLDYAGRWLSENVSQTEMELRSMQIFQRIQDENRQAFTAAVQQLTAYFNQLKEIYKEDLNLDPYPVDPKSVDRGLSPELQQKIDSLLQEQQKLQETPDPK